MSEASVRIALKKFETPYSPSKRHSTKESMWQKVGMMENPDMDHAKFSFNASGIACISHILTSQEKHQPIPLLKSSYPRSCR
mmetsp:Transcript_22019/g.39710  ORF Transcript_22019/g.39710 Transcript_22019/m.39710 type:complete len:82 (-) Transcript_22019:1646-1891(-)